MWAAARRDQARSSEEARARKYGASRRGVSAIVGVVVRGVRGTEAAGFHVRKDARPELDTVAKRERIGVRRTLGWAGEYVQAAENYLAATRARPLCEFEGAAREREMHGDADDFGNRLDWRAAVEKIFVPVLNGPVRRRGGREARECKCGREDMLAEARMRILGIERINKKRVAEPDVRSS